MKLLYKVVLPELASDGESERDQANLSESGILQADESVVEQLSNNPEEVDLQGRIQYGLPYSKMVAKELKELANSSIEDVPLFRVGDRDWDGAGYYEVDRADVNPGASNAEEVWQYSLTLSADGTQGSRYRVIETNERKTEHEFGNDLGVELGIPADARKVRWYDSDDRDLEAADPVETRPSEFGEIDIYDVDDSEFEDPDLLYEVDYALEYETDCKVYDTRGESEKYDEGDDGRIRQWQSVFVTSHDVDDAIVLDNGLIRLRLDEREGTLSAERYDPEASSGDTLLLTGDSDDGAWTSVSLSDEDVDVYDIDISEIGMIRDKLQITFDVSGDLFVLDAILQTGAESILFDNPDAKGQGPIPASLEEMLSPVASERYIDTQSAKTLTRRRDVRLSPSND